MSLTADRIKKQRKKNNLTMQDLAEKMGVSKTTIVEWENGKREPKQDVIDKLSEFLDVDKAYLLGLQKEEKIISLANFIMELGNERFTKFFNELRTNFSEQDYDNLTNIVSAYSLLDNEDRIFFTKSMALKSGLIDRTFKAENGKIIFIDNDKPSS
ncbi:helix-turn-helix domain-containing protein [Lactococcus sp. AK05]|uniref:helix-turn-helix domain-containing protein n=1 Tax=Lactococcus sp. AK05 TaxID=3239197 RepID=UPI0034E017B6